MSNVLIPINFDGNSRQYQQGIYMQVWEFLKGFSHGSIDSYNTDFRKVLIM